MAASLKLNLSLYRAFSCQSYSSFIAMEALAVEGRFPHALEPALRLLDRCYSICDQLLQTKLYTR